MNFIKITALVVIWIPNLVFAQAASLIAEPTTIIPGTSGAVEAGGGGDAGVPTNPSGVEEDNGSVSTGNTEMKIPGIEHEDIGITGESDDNDTANGGAKEHDPGIMILEASFQEDERDGEISDSSSTGEEEAEVKESGEKGGTEDINIGIGELHGSSNAAPDSFFDIFVDIADDDTREAMDAFLKIGDVKGESTDAEMKDDESGTIRFGDGERGAREPEASKGEPKEIVVVGSKVRDEVQASGVEVRGWDPTTKKVTITPDDIETQENFVDFIGAVTLSDENIESVSFNFKKIVMEYDQPAKLFGFINIDMGATAEVDEAGKVKVKFPWYRFLTRNNATEVKTNIQNSVGENGDQTPAQNQTDLDLLRERARTFQTISNVMRVAHDTAMASIRNLK